MRIALLYPPPWKIPAPGEAPDTSGDGPPADYREGDLDPDFHQTPYGLYSLGAQLVMWTVIGLVFASMADRLLGQSRRDVVPSQGAGGRLGEF